MAARAGLNGVLSWPDAAGRTTRAFQVRVASVQHALMPIATESAGRARRAMYPHRMSQGEFSLGLLVVGQAERAALTGFLGGFAAALLTPGTAAGLSMDVQVPSRGFHRRGVPTAGMEWGARLGQVVFRPTVVFQTSWDPSDTDPATPSAIPTVVSTDPAEQYFFPFGTQLQGQDAAPGSILTPWSPPAGLKHMPDPQSWGQ